MTSPARPIIALAIFISLLCAPSGCARRGEPQRAADLPPLSAQAKAVEGVTATGSYERFRRVRVSVIAPAELAGKPLEIRDGDKLLASAALAATEQSKSGIDVNLPLPTPTQPYGTLTVLVNGRPAATVSLPPLQQARKSAFESADLVFRPSVFSTARFPPGDFEQPNLVEDLIGPYSLKTTFYDAQYNQVSSAGKVGRYGAITRITAADGKTYTRYTTLFRRSGKERMDWEDPAADLALKLPADLAIDPAVAKEQSHILASHLAGLFRDSLSRPSATTVLLAGLYETKPGAGKLPRRLDPWAKDRDWWFGLKNKLAIPTTYGYASFLPADYDRRPAARWPLILFLHGAGERGDDLKRVEVHGPHKHFKGKDLPFIMIYPQCPNREWWSPIQLNGLLDEICAKYRVDPDRIYLTGLSMGGFGSWDLAMAYPDRFAAVVPICGGGDPSDVQRTKDIPIWVFHGGRDPVVPVSRTHEMVTALAKINARVKYTIYPDLDHDSWSITYNNPDLYAWLLSQRRAQPQQPPATTIPTFGK